MNESIQKVHDIIKSAEDIKIYTHIDCDGVCAGAILSSTLDLLGKDHDVEFADINQVSNLSFENELTILSDLGSGQYLASPTKKVVILDHHIPIRKEGLYSRLVEVNPHFWGLDGSYEVSGSGMAYCLARSFGFRSLSWLAVLGAVGDIQYSSSGKLESINRKIVKESIEVGLVVKFKDLNIYGKHTKYLATGLSYFNDVKIPITGNVKEANLMLLRLNIPRKKEDGKFRYLCDLTQNEKKKIFSELHKMMLKVVPKNYIKYIPSLISGESYEFLSEEKYTSFRNASEFSTVINACCHQGKHKIALDFLKGGGEQSLRKITNISTKHRLNISQTIRKMHNKVNIIQMKNIQYFDGGSMKSDMIGTMAMFLINKGDWRKPIIGFVRSGNTSKLSLRCSHILSHENVHFGKLMKKVAEKVGGSGGGHQIACGAYIPYDQINKFLKLFDSFLEGT